MHVFNSHRGQLGMHLPEDLIVDNFAGGGGASMGIEMALGRPIDIAINHSEKALSMHEVNHPNTAHYCESVWDVDPVKACNGSDVGLGWFSPDCKHFSRAKGSKPVDKNIRGLAWVAVRWGMKVNMHKFVLENVQEFKSWGPLIQKGDGSHQPDPDKKGETFDGFIKALSTGLTPKHPAWHEAVIALDIQYNQKEKLKLFRGLGYQVQHNVLSACDFGAPTTRQRFFLIARKDGQSINWPVPTHGAPDSIPVKNGSLQPWKTAAEIIDWSIPCKSIFNRKKPLADKTLARIARGIKKFVLEDPNPFIVRIGQTGFGGDGMQYDINTPLTTITSKAEHCLVTPTIQPVRNNSDLCMSFLAQHYGGGYTGAGSSLRKPVNTITAVDHNALVTSHLVKFRGNESGQSVKAPVPTITAGGMHIGEVRSFLIKYYGTDTGQSVKDPLHTIPTRDRFGLVTVKGVDYQIVDIGMRMLKPHELYAAQSFPSYYIHDADAQGKKLTQAEQVLMCGNSVPPLLAKALIEANEFIEKEQVAA